MKTKQLVAQEMNKVNGEIEMKMFLCEIQESGICKDLSWNQFVKSTAPYKAINNYEVIFEHKLIKKAKMSFSKQIDYNRFVRNNKPTFEQKIQWIFDNTFVKIDKNGICY